MNSRNSTRSVYLAVLALATVALLFFGVTRAQAEGSVVAAPGSFTLEYTGGTIDLGGYDPVTIGAGTITASGTVDADGNITIPESSVQQTTNVTISGIELKFVAKGDWTGQIDPSTNAVGIRMPIAIQLPASPGCEVGPIDINRGLTTNPGGVAYNSTDGSFTLAASNVSVPSATTCGDVLNSLVNGLTAGTANIAWGFKMNPPATSGGSSIAGGILASESSSLSSSSSSGSSSSVVNNSTINNYLTSSAAAPKIRLTASIASKRYKRGYISTYASASEDCLLSARVTLSGAKSIKGKKLNSSQVLVEADEEKTLKAKVSKKLRRKIAAVKRRGGHVYATVRIKADNGDDEPTTKTLKKFKL